MIEWIRIKKFCELTGDSDDAVRANMIRHWPDGVIWKKAPNGTIYINPENFNLWVEGKVKSSNGAKGKAEPK